MTTLTGDPSQLPYWSLPPEDAARGVETDMENGLSEGEAAQRLERFGRNAFENSKPESKLKIFLGQLTSPLIVILIASCIVTLAIAHYQDAVFIFIAVAANSALGYWQENKAERALAELKTYLKRRARVIRGGREYEVDAEEIVPGDIVRLSQGDRVPADSRVIFANDFQTDESILTGESLPVVKSVEPVSANAPVADRASMLFAGTLVTQGVCTAIVCTTGSGTELGKIASLLASSRSERTPLQKAITTFSIYLSIVLGILTVAIFVLGTLSGRGALEMFLTSVAVAVSAIPEGLPISMTVILAVGVERMAKRKGVVRRLVAAEALGSTTVILTDKTGTLTKAEMALSEIASYGPDEDTLLSRALANADVLVENPEDHPAQWRMDGRIMEKALVRSAALRGMPLSRIADKSAVSRSLPFNAVRKFAAALLEGKDGRILSVFGAPDILLRYSSLDEAGREAVLERIDALASSGQRVLGVASLEVGVGVDLPLDKDFVPAGLSFDGLLCFRDPVRPGIREAIARVGQAGIRTVVLTGDHHGTAVAVAREIGLEVGHGAVLTAGELSAMSDDALRERLPQLTVISRVTPLDKLRIAKLLQESGEIVAMTGDGVNDAPSIKQANVGIAMGSGTEVARSVADLVLLDDNFETIVAAVEEGRQILGNLRKVLVYLLSNVASGMILICGSILAGVALPLNALQILWVNFFSDSFPAVAFAFEKGEGGLAEGRPHGKGASLFDPLMRFLIMVIGISTSALLFVLYLLLLYLGYDPAVVQTFVFAAFGTRSLLVAFPVRSFGRGILSYPLFSNRYLTGGVLLGILLMAVAIYVPILQSLFGTVSLPLPWVVGAILFSIANIVLIECAKWLFRPGRRPLSRA